MQNFYPLQQVFAHIPDGFFREGPITENMAVRPITDMDHLIMRYFVAETGRGFGVIEVSPIIGRGFFLFFQMGKEQDRMEMRPALFLAVFTCDEIPNFVTRPTKQLDEQLKVARLEQLVREILTGRIGQVHDTGVRTDRSSARHRPT